MAQLLHHQDSAFYGKELHGCRWSILQFFGFRRRLRSTKMLSDKKHAQGKNSRGSRRRNSYAPLKNEASGIVDDEKHTEVTKKEKSSKKNSSKASLRSLILKKLYGKEGQKEKMLPVAPKLLRTISIHYLESNEYVLDGQSTSSGDGSSHSTKLSMQNATDTNLHHAISSIPYGCDSDLSSSLLPKRDDGRVKRKSHRSISMDGVLHKVPYGKKVSEDVLGEGLPRSASVTYDRDGLKPYIGTAAKRNANQGFRRSRSLTESLENYSRLLDSISSSESKRILNSSKSIRDHSLDGSSAMTSLRETSEVELRSQGLVHDENLATPEDALASHVQEQTNVDGNVNIALDESSSDVVTGGSENPAFIQEYINEKRCDVAVSAEEDSCTDQVPSEVVGTSEEQAASCDDNDQVSSSDEVELCAVLPTSEEIDTPEEHAEACDDDNHIHSSTQSDSCTDLPTEDAIIEEHCTPTSYDNQANSFQNSKPTEDTFLKPRILHLDYADVSTDIYAVQETVIDAMNGLQEDPAHEVEFNYVKDMFKKSSFSNETLFDDWCSQNSTALQEDDCQHYEAAAAAFDFTDVSADQLLLFDLINEALLDIYKKYSVSKSKFSWFPSLDRPKPVGHGVLKELWSRVSYHLDERPRSSIEVDTILSNDLAKSDRWMNFPRGADHLGNKVADFVFDKLLTELILQLAEC